MDQATIVDTTEENPKFRSKKDGSTRTGFSSENNDDSRNDDRLANSLQEIPSILAERNERRVSRTGAIDRESSPSIDVGESTQEDPSEKIEVGEAVTFPQHPPSPPPASPSRFVSYFDPYSQHSFSPGSTPTQSPRRGLSQLLDDSSRTPRKAPNDPLNDESSRKPWRERHNLSNIELKRLEREDSMDSAEELALLASEIRSEIRNFEMLELAEEAERAADAGQERFAGRASTFGDDLQTTTSFDTIESKPMHLRRHRTDMHAERGSLLRRTIMIPRLEQKIGVLSLRSVNEVIPPMSELHVHLRTHFASNGVDQRTLLTPISLEERGNQQSLMRPKRNSPDRIIRSFTNWVSSVSSCEREAKESTNLDSRLRPSTPEPTFSADPYEFSLNSLVAGDDGDGETSASAIAVDDTVEIGSTLAGHLHSPSASATTHIRKFKSDKGPNRLVLPRFAEKHERADCSTLTTVPTSSSSDVEPLAVHKSNLANDAKSATSTSSDHTVLRESPDRLLPKSLFDLTEHDHDRDEVQSVANSDSALPGPPGLFATPQRLRSIKRQVEDDDIIEEHTSMNNNTATLQISVGWPALATACGRTSVEMVQSRMEEQESQQPLPLRPRSSDGYAQAELFSKKAPVTTETAQGRVSAPYMLNAKQVEPVHAASAKTDDTNDPRRFDEPNQTRSESDTSLLNLPLFGERESMGRSDLLDSLASRPQPPDDGAAEIRRRTHFESQSERRHSKRASFCADDTGDTASPHPTVTSVPATGVLAKSRNQMTLADEEDLQEGIGPILPMRSDAAKGPCGPVPDWNASMPFDESINRPNSRRSPSVVDVPSHDTEDTARLNAFAQEPPSQMADGQLELTPSDRHCQCFVTATAPSPESNVSSKSSRNIWADERRSSERVNRVLSWPNLSFHSSLNEPLPTTKPSVTRPPDRLVVSDAGQRRTSFKAAMIAMDAITASMNRLPGGLSPSQRSSGRRARSEAGSDTPLTAAGVAMDVWKSISPRRRREPAMSDELYIPATENRAFLSNYLYCSKAQAHHDDGTANGDCANPCLVNVGTMEAGCEALVGAFNAAIASFPANLTSKSEKSSISIRGPTKSYSQLEPEKWLDMATEKVDVALEKLVGSSNGTWDMFQPPSLRKKTPMPTSPNRKASVPVVIVRQDNHPSSRTDSEGAFSMTEIQFERLYGMRREEFISLPVTERTSLHDSMIRGGHLRRGSNLL